MTTIRDLKDEGDHLLELLTELKNHCGAGGTVADGVIELQGDQRERVEKFLSQLGYKTIVKSRHS